MQTKKKPVFLFSEKFPKGEMFTLDEIQLEEKLKDGWVDTPTKLNLPEEDLMITAEEKEALRPQDIKAMCEGMGFIVLTPEQLSAEANKMAAVAMEINEAVDLSLVNDELIKEEYFKRFPVEEIEEAEILGESSEVLEETDPVESVEEIEEDSDAIKSFLEIFEEDPTVLTKLELVELGNTKYKLGLRENMKEATLIEKILEAMKG